ncbi:hypothetical protein H5U35_03915 [Candidatus Aerophobetes bacterium]|nr:hypothetical protein [Candidatus Aerophobetes bacterium]
MTNKKRGDTSPMSFLRRQESRGFGSFTNRRSQVKKKAYTSGTTRGEHSSPCHSCESRNPGSMQRETLWTPAFAGMTGKRRDTLLLHLLIDTLYNVVQIVKICETGWAIEVILNYLKRIL